MAEHTQTPWAHREGILHEAADRWKCLPINSPYVEGAFEAGNDGHDVAVANAAFIVKAINSHDALVKALHRLTNEVRGIFDAFEYGIRKEISNTNFAVVCEKLEEASRAIESIKGTA